MAKYKRKSENPHILLLMDWSELFLGLDNESAGYILKGIYAHRLGNDLERSENPLVNGLLEFINTQCDKNKEGYLERCAKNAENRAKQTSKGDDGQPTSTMVDLNKNINRNKNTNTNRNNIIPSTNSNNVTISNAVTKDTPPPPEPPPLTEEDQAELEVRRFFESVRRQR